MRSDDDVNLAGLKILNDLLLLGGGGHMRAAGCNAGPDEEASLQTLLSYIAEQLGCAL